MMKTETGLQEQTLRQKNKSIYWAWKSIKQRCLNPKCSAYKNYGARGITVCDEWMKFEPFCMWALENGYSTGLDIDRIDNEGIYEPRNCRWVERRTNVNNRRKTLMFTVDGETKCRTEWEKDLDLPNGILKCWYEKYGNAYVESRIKDIIANGYIRKNYSYSHNKNVMHCESGLVFDSVKEAAKHFGIKPCTISNAIRANRSTGKGKFTFEILEES